MHEWPETYQNTPRDVLFAECAAMLMDEGILGVDVSDPLGMLLLACNSVARQAVLLKYATEKLRSAGDAHGALENDLADAEVDKSHAAGALRRLRPFFDGLEHPPEGNTGVFLVLSPKSLADARKLLDDALSALYESR